MYGARLSFWIGFVSVVLALIPGVVLGLCAAFFHWLDTTYERQVNWALDHSGVIIAASAATFLLTFPLNRISGRDFVPNEDMGEWTIHLDAPEGTSLDGTQELGFRVLKELSGVEGVADIEPIVNPGGAGVWELPGLGRSKPAFGQRYEHK